MIVSPGLSKSHFIVINMNHNSLRGRRLKGKGKGVWGARETRWGASRVSLAPKTPFPFPFKRLPCRLESQFRT